MQFYCHLSVGHLEMYEILTLLFWFIHWLGCSYSVEMDQNVSYELHNLNTAAIGTNIDCASSDKFEANPAAQPNPSSNIQSCKRSFRLIPT